MKKNIKNLRKYENMREEEETPFTLNPKVYIYLCPITLLFVVFEGWGDNLFGILHAHVMESCLIGANLLCPDLIDLAEMYQFNSESIQLFPSIKLLSLHPWLHSIHPDHFLLYTCSSYLLKQAQNT